MKEKIYGIKIKDLSTVIAISFLAFAVLLPQLCLAAAGDLDPAFGNNGKVITHFSSGYAVIYGMAFQPDGKVVTVGATETGGLSGRDFALARYNPDGSLDSSFDNDGLVVTDFGSRDEAAASVVIQADGKIVVADGKLGVGTDSLWQRLCQALDLPELAADSRFTTNGDRVHNGVRRLGFGESTCRDT